MMMIFFFLRVFFFKGKKKKLAARNCLIEPTMAGAGYKVMRLCTARNGKRLVIKCSTSSFHWERVWCFWGGSLSRQSPYSSSHGLENEIVFTHCAINCPETWLLSLFYPKLSLSLHLAVSGRLTASTNHLPPSFLLLLWDGDLRNARACRVIWVPTHHKFPSVWIESDSFFFFPSFSSFSAHSQHVWS